jgi:O-methyltransferase involved in polyketide biosynthesis
MLPNLRPDGSGAISPTAHYTGYVWARNGLSPPELATFEGRVLFESLRPTMVVSGLLGGGTLESYLLARHRAIDALLERAVDEHEATQVVEVAAGMSGRGVRFAQRYGERVRYIEADLPTMARRKRATLGRMGALSDRHEVRELDVLQESGPQSLAALIAELDHQQGLAIVTEGLLGYLEPETVRSLWRRFASELEQFRYGTYVSDIHIGELQDVRVRVFRVLLSAFVRGRVHLHFGDEREVQSALLQAGFAAAAVHRAADLSGDGSDPAANLAHTLEAAARRRLSEISTA